MTSKAIERLVVRADRITEALDAFEHGDPDEDDQRAEEIGVMRDESGADSCCNDATPGGSTAHASKTKEQATLSDRLPSATKKRKTRFTYTPARDEVLLIAILGDDGLFVEDGCTKRQKWARVHSLLVGKGFSVSEHSIKKRLDHLVTTYNRAENVSARASGAEEQVTPIMQLLEDYCRLAGEESKQKEAVVKKKADKDKDDAIGGKRIRDAAVSNMDTTREPKRSKTTADVISNAILHATEAHAELKKHEIESQRVLLGEFVAANKQTAAQMMAMNQQMLAAQAQMMKVMAQLLGQTIENE